MSKNIRIPSGVTTSRSSEFNEIVRSIDDETLASAMADPMSRTVVLHAVFDEMPRRLIGDRVEGVDSVVCWRIGEPADMWTVVVANSRCTVHQGNPGLDPAVTLELGMVPFLRMIAGQMGGMALLVTGNLRIKGNMMTARKMEKWFVRD